MRKPYRHIVRHIKAPQRKAKAVTHPFLKTTLNRISQSHPRILERIDWAAIRATQQTDRDNHLKADKEAIDLERASKQLGPTACP